MKKLFLNILFFVFMAVVLAFSVRGLPGNPTPKQLNSLAWKDDGPMELSPERGRYALLYSLVEDKSFSFSVDLARFAAPDVGYISGKYASLFAPSVSFLAIPGYVIGKFFGLAQVGTFAVIGLFAILNVLLIRAIAIRFGAHPLAASIGGAAFLFASPAYAYAVTLYQHHISTFLILLSIYLLIGLKPQDERHKKKDILSLAAIWMLCAFSVSVDYPNLFMMFPIGVAALGKTILVKKKFGFVAFKIPLLRVLAISAVIVPMVFFLWFNKMSYGNPFQLSGSLERVMEIKSDNKPLFEIEVIKKQLQLSNQPAASLEKSSLGFFMSRNLINGVSEHFFSLDRGMLAFTPIMLFGILGVIMAIKRRMPLVGLFVAVLGFNILLYSMWGDPYGGWAFGSRYLIPSYAILAIFISFMLTRFVKSNLFLLAFFIVLSYSVGVNTLGAVTSNRNPPKVEIPTLEKQTHKHEEYTYMRNINLLNANISKSYMFERYASNYVTAWNYYTYLMVFILTGMATLLVSFKGAFLKKERLSIKIARRGQVVLGKSKIGGFPTFEPAVPKDDVYEEKLLKPAFASRPLTYVKRNLFGRRKP